MTQQDFDKACAVFSETMQIAAIWKHSYAGAAYSTRLRQAINDAREACDAMEIILNYDEKSTPTAQAESA